MNPSDPSLTDYPQSLILPGVRLQEAIKQDSGVQEAFDTYTRRAYRLPGAAAQASAFLATTFKGDAEKLMRYVTSELLVDELSAGSHVLASIAAEHWDRNQGTDRLTELARKLNDSWSDKLHNHEALEFCLALVTAVAILHPDVAAQLLDHCEPACASDPKLREACAEAREWQHSGELIAQATPDQQRFWHEQLARRGGDWIWDTEEARQAVRALETANPEAAAKASLLVDRIPGWAWNIRVQKPSKTAVAEAPRRKPSPALTILKWAAAVLIGVGLGALWDSAPVREFVASRSAKAPTHTESPAVVAATPAAKVVQSLVPSVTPSPAPVAAPPADGPRPVMATLPKQPESELPLAAKAEPTPTTAAEFEPPAVPSMVKPAAMIAAEPPAVTAQPVPVRPGSKPGWVQSPLGDEFEVTDANAKDGRITDSSGRVWSLPAELAAKPVTASAPTPSKPLEMAQAAPPAIIESAPPAVPPAPAPPPANPTPAAAQPAPAAPQPPVSPAPAPTEKPVVAAPAAPATPAPQTAAPAPVQTVQPAAAPSSQPAKALTLHPDYFAKPTAKPDASAKKTTSTKPKASPAPEAQSDRVFVTRASSIRLSYRNGIWVSKPGAYLPGAASSPQEWARDMTLRERSSGSIPEDYVFQVLNNGIVQVVPDPAKH